MTSPTTRPHARSQDGAGQGHPDGPRLTGDSEQTAADISAALSQLRLLRDTVGNKEWLSAELADGSAAPLGTLSSTASPLAALSDAGCGFLHPMISFLEEPLGQLRGEPDAVSGPAGQHDTASRQAASVADDYLSTVDRETSEWSGDAKTNYLQTATKLTDGVLSIAETAGTNAKAMIAAGEVVAQAIERITEEITKAVGRIVPIMTEAIAAAPLTGGASIAKAIPECVAIAAEHGGVIAAQLAALLASGDNLVKLIEGAVGALKVVREGLKVIGDLAGGDSPGAASAVSAGSDPDGESSGMRGPQGERETSKSEHGKQLDSDDPDNNPGELDDPLAGEWIPIRGNEEV
ncbi:WXG100 family type VII secretion target [Saccharomonospora cyanea]|uniref:ESX-1 secretion-associated protein EspA/EspE-like domain-containing protein n=1 Tax=Saccharomonospora cyanea NA-134 TaxID=882082 RepID=H5XHF9_9PSEU|nr:hypothetical protein [Saccharomonospora cyanea]EHR61639.1 hypothetical protein SaccyDRAFT_2793 [Saccharomonospora cyanea NA-134]